jgi:hypothetical protein
MTSASPIAATFRRTILTMRCTVYSRTANTGPYNLPVKTGLACRLDTVGMQPAATSSQRSDLASIRTFAYDVTYELPLTGVQIELTSPAHYAGQRWNIRSGTQKPAILPGYDGPIYIEVDVTRAT